jgi:hypothetical protein
MSTFDEPKVGEVWEDVGGGARASRQFRVEERAGLVLRVWWLDTREPGVISQNAFRLAPDRFRVARRP